MKNENRSANGMYYHNANSIETRQKFEDWIKATNCGAQDQKCGNDKNVTREN